MPAKKTKKQNKTPKKSKKEKKEKDEEKKTKEEKPSEDKGGSSGSGERKLVFTRPKDVMITSNKVLWVAIITLVASALFFGAGVYFYQDYFYKSQIEKFEDQISLLNEEVQLFIQMSELRMSEVGKEEPATTCPQISITSTEDAVLAANSPLTFTRPSEGGWRITDASTDTACQRLAWSAAKTTEEGAVSVIYVSTIDGQGLETYNIFETAREINLLEFDNRTIVFSHHGLGDGSPEWWEGLKDSTAKLDLNTGEVYQWGEVYSYSADLGYAVIYKEGKDILVDLGDGEELAVLSEDGQDEALDYVFSSDGQRVAYIFIPGQEGSEFYSDYFDICEDILLEGQIRTWDIARVGHSVVYSGNVNGMRLIDWQSSGKINYTKWEADNVAKTLQIP
jgi:hypothetical protein